MRVSFKTFGCRLNQAESAKYEALFKVNGIDVVPFGTQSDICIIHSCSVTQRAESECLRVVRSIKRKNPDACVALVGCAVESATPAQLTQLGIDLIVPRADKEQLVEIVLNAINVAYSAAPAGLSPLFSTHRALLKIQDGCNFFCSYCIIPYNRGAPVTRNFDECLDEARAYIDQGFHEIVITGCNIACYNDDGRTLPDIVAAICALPGIGRVRLGSIEPGTVELDIAKIMAGTDKICNFLHLPLQSCDDGILRRMNRRYQSADIRRVLDQIITTIPQIALGSDIITGFPGESAAAFNNTKAFIEDYPFSNLHIFPYSERRGTAAADFDNSTPHIIRRERAQELITIGKLKRDKYAHSWIGQKVDLLAEKFDQDGGACGWSGEYLPCQIRGIPAAQESALSGKIISFTVDSVEEDVLSGSSCASS